MINPWRWLIARPFRHRLFFGWVILTGSFITTYPLFRLVSPGNDYFFRYSLGLFVANSCLLFLLPTDQLPVIKVLLGFLLALDLVVGIYLGLQFMSA